MNFRIYCVLVAVVLSAGHVSVVKADGIKHEPIASLRLRFSTLEDGELDGRATSGRLRLGLDSHWTDHIHTRIQLDHVETGYQDRHSDGVRFNGQPRIPDAPGTDLNEAFVHYDGSRVELILGRQLLEWDNQRYLGSVSFWQNEQTFDAAQLKIPFASRSRVDYAYIGNANRIFGDDADETLAPTDINFEALNGVRPAATLGDHRHNTHMLRTEINEWDYSSVMLYGHHIDNRDAKATSNNAVGFQYGFKFKPSRLQYRLDLELAAQQRTEIAGKPTLSYSRIDAGIGLRSLELSLRQEVLGGNGNAAFITPMGSLHEFHGWADHFNNAPPVGLVDQSLRLLWRFAPFKLDMRFHRFEGEETGEKFGEEIDLELIYKINKRHTLLLRMADFSRADEGSPFEDRQRIFFHYAFNL